MATERIIIVVEERGTRRVREEIRRVGDESTRSSGSVNLLRRALLGLGAVTAIRSTIGLADTFVSLNNRLRVTGLEGEALAATFERIRNISNDTRTPLEANIQLYQRATLAAQELGASQDQLFQLVTVVGQALAIQGSSAEQSSGALLQLSQALGSGIVRAEEFNSILEGAFPIAQAAARGIDAAGGSISRLRSLVIEGRVTSRQFFDALLSQSEALEESFSRTVPTVGQSFTILRNDITTFIGQANEAIGVTEALSRTLILLSRNLDVVATATIGAGVAFAAIRFGPLIIGAAQAVASLIAVERAIISGRAVALGSAEADRQRAAASVAAAQADVLKTQTTLANVRAEAARAIVVRDSAAAIFGQAAIQKQVAAIEATLVIQTNALTAAQSRLATATVAANAQAGIFGRVLLLARNGVNALTAAIAANPIGAIAVALTAVITLLVAFRNQILVTSDGVTTLGDLFIATFEALRSVVRTVVDFAVASFNAFIQFFNDNFGFIADFARNIFGDVELTVESAALFIARVVDRQIGIWVGLFNVISLGVTTARETFGTQIDAVISLVSSAIDALIRGVRAAVTQVVDFVNRLINAANAALEILGQTGFDEVILGGFSGVQIVRAASEAADATFAAGSQIREAFLEGFNQTVVQDAVQGVFDRAREIAQERIEFETIQAEVPVDVAPTSRGLLDIFGLPSIAIDPERSAAIEEINADLENQAMLLGLTNRERQISVDLQALEQELRRATGNENAVFIESERLLFEERLRNLQALEDQAALLEEIRGPQEDLAARQQALIALFDQGRITADEYATGLRNIREAALETDLSLRAGIQRGILQIQDTIAEFGRQAETTLVGAFNSAEDALVSFVQTGEVNFSRLVDSILADLTRLLARQGLDLLFGDSGLFGGGGTGGGGGAGGLLRLFGSLFGGRQIGGPMTTGQTSIVGENGPELFQAPSPGNIIPAGPTQAALGRPQVTVVVVNQGSDEDIFAALETPEADEVIFNKISRNPNRVNASLGRRS